jgi:glycosyltransferase involved in cell wall biosynthesis
MAESLDRLIDSPEAAKELGERGRERAESLFTAARVVPQYEAMYRRVLNR